MLSRRALVGKLAAGAAVAWAASVTWANAASSARREVNTPANSEHGSDWSGAAPEVIDASPREAIEASPPATAVDAGPPATASAPPPWELLRPLALGSVVAHGWRVAELSGVVDGSCVLTLQNAARPRRIACISAATMGARRAWCTRSGSTWW